MTVDVKIAGSALTPGERQYWVSEATVVEDATSLSLADSFGGVGSIQIDTDLLDNTMLVQGADLEVTFAGAGTRTGTVQGITGTNGRAASLSGETKMARLNRTIQTSVVKTTIGDALKQYLGKCGLPPTQYAIDAGIAARTCVLPGWSGNAWEKIREMGAVEGFDVQDVAGVVTVRPLGVITLNIDNADSFSETLGENVQGLNVETHFYDYAVINGGLVYPQAEWDSTTGAMTPAGWRPDFDILEVTPGEPLEIDVPLMASLTSVQQPQPRTLVEPDHEGSSVYTVVTNDGVQAIDPAVWTAHGGKITVTILPDSRTLRIRIDAGENLIDLAPYRIALTSGAGRDYSTLRIIGNGVSIGKTRLRLRTPVPAALTDQEVATTTDSMFCRTQTQARRQLRAQSAMASRSVGGLQAQVASIPNVFGQRAGAIIRTPDCHYRVRTVTTNTLSTALQADRHTPISAFNAAWAGKTIAEFNEVWAGYTARAFNAKPLRTSLPTAPVLPTSTGYGSGGYGSAEYGD